MDTDIGSQPHRNTYARKPVSLGRRNHLRLSRFLPVFLRGEHTQERLVRHLTRSLYSKSAWTWQWATRDLRGRVQLALLALDYPYDTSWNVGTSRSFVHYSLLLIPILLLVLISFHCFRYPDSSHSSVFSIIIRLHCSRSRAFASLHFFVVFFASLHCFETLPSLAFRCLSVSFAFSALTIASPFAPLCSSVPMVQLFVFVLRTSFSQFLRLAYASPSHTPFG